MTREAPVCATATECVVTQSDSVVTGAHSMPHSGIMTDLDYKLLLLRKRSLVSNSGNGCAIIGFLPCTEGLF